MDTFAKAAQNRSIRTIKTELDFLLDSNLLTQNQISQITAILPSSAESSYRNGSGATDTTSNNYPPPAVRNQSNLSHTATSPRLNTFNTLSLNEKSSATPPPPSYASSGPPSIATATSLYAYAPNDPNDLALQPNDRVIITEYANADWARGRNERTGQEGIFPRSYVNVIEEKKGNAGPPPLLPVRNQSHAHSSGYGNMPVEVAGQSGAGMTGQQQMPEGAAGGNSKFNDQGKKFGKKLGNAAIFGAGASIGGNIVNSIF